MKNGEKVILDLCGGTGSWSEPYRDAGYRVHVLTLPAWDVTKVEFHSRAMEFIRQDACYEDTLTVLYEDVHGILAAPPCTEFSIAKGGLPRDFEGGVEVMAACMEIIWKCRTHGKPAFWAMENPVGFMRQFMGVPHFTFKQWQYGEMRVKATDVWGYFKEPRATVSERPEMLSLIYPKGTSHSKAWNRSECPKKYRHMGLDRSAVRAITPPGFAEAFYRANR